MESSSKPVDNATRVVAVGLMLLIVLFVLQMVLVRHTGVKVGISLILVAIMGGAVGWLVPALRADHQDPDGHE